MYDYKFRHAASTAHKPKAGLRRHVVRAAAILLATAAFYGAFQLDNLYSPPEPQVDSDSNIIPLTLPPPRELPESSNSSESSR